MPGTLYASSYDYDKSLPFHSTSTIEYKSSLYKRYLVTYDSNGEKIPASYFVPAGEGPFPAVVVVHGIFSATRDQFWSFGAEAAKYGIAVLIPSLPFHHERTPKGAMMSGQGIVNLKSTDATVTNIEKAVAEIRRGVDWLSAQPEVDRTRLGCAGLSLGAIIASLALKIDGRFSSGAIVVGGAGIDELFDTSRGFTVGMLRLASDFGLFNIKDMVSKWNEVDPCNFKNPPGLKILMLNGTTDPIFPIYNVRLLENSWDSLEYRWTNSMHDYPQKYAEIKVAEWFRRTLRSRGFYSIGGVDIQEQLIPEVDGMSEYKLDLVFNGLGSKATHKLTAPLTKKRAPVLIGTHEEVEEHRRLYGKIDCVYYEISKVDSINLAYAARFLLNSGIPDINHCYIISSMVTEKRRHNITVNAFLSAEISGLLLSAPTMSVPYSLMFPDNIDRELELEEATLNLNVKTFVPRPTDTQSKKRIPNLATRIWGAAYSAITFSNDWLFNLRLNLFYN